MTAANPVRPAPRLLPSAVFLPRDFPLLRSAGYAALVTAFLWATSSHTIAPRDAILAYILLLIPWFAYTSWKQGTREEFPLFAALSAAYWMAYGAQLFWTPHQILWNGIALSITENGLTKALLLAVAGVLALALGMRLGVGRVLKGRSVPDLRNSRSTTAYLLALMLLGLSACLIPNFAFLFGARFRQVMIIFLSTVPLVAFAIILRKCVLRPSRLTERLVLTAFVLVTCASSLSAGWLGGGIAVIVVAAAIVLSCNVRIPKATLAAIFLYLLFFQVGKEEFRMQYWHRQDTSSSSERLRFWFARSILRWRYVLNNPTVDNFRDLAVPTLGRFSLLGQTANVIELTPDYLPYQGSKLYSYMLVTWVPRFLWPAKPSVNEANRYYQVAYGLTSPDQLDQVSISVGVLTEAYISYGWFGALGLMVLLGILLDGVRVIFLQNDSGEFLLGLGTALLPGFIIVESQMAQYLGGVVQHVGLTAVVMLPVLQRCYRRPLPGPAAVGMPRLTAPAGLRRVSG